PFIPAKAVATIGRGLWMLVVGRFLSALGDGFFFPFLALYLSRVHHLPPSQVGVVMSVAAAGSLLGRLPGGYLADRFGFKPVAVAGLSGAGLAVVAAGLAATVPAFVVAYTVQALFVWGSFPALVHGAALLSRPGRREEAFSYLNLASNAGFAIGPMAGALVVGRDFRLIFWIDGCTFLLFAALLALAVPALREEAAPRPPGSASSLREALALPPLRASRFWRVALGGLLTAMVYSQLGSTLPAELGRRYASVGWYGFLWTLNGAMIALLQVPVSRLGHDVERRLRMSLAAVAYGLGMLVIWAADAPWLYFVAFGVITLGEIVYSPLPPAEFAALAPPGQGARYQAAGNLLAGAGSALGPAAGGGLLALAGPSGLWLGAAALGLAAAAVLRPEGRRGPAAEDPRA
ncbi:MAG: MFS transporter, partial [Bacillota bacterium]|nr:MFS transporter [Bacillota bacterium]